MTSTNNASNKLKFQCNFTILYDINMLASVYNKISFDQKQHIHLLASRLFLHSNISLPLFKCLPFSI